MTKQLVEWHETCLKAQKATYERDVLELQHLQEKVVRGYEAITEYEKQIEEAKRRGKVDFDRDKFLVKRS